MYYKGTLKGELKFYSLFWFQYFVQQGDVQYHVTSVHAEEKKSVEIKFLFTHKLFWIVHSGNIDHMDTKWQTLLAK